MPNWSTTQLAEHYRKLGEPSPVEAACGDGRSKYGNRKVTVGGLKFDSELEARHWEVLKIAEQAGAISDLRRQVRFELQPAVRLPHSGVQRAIVYVADMVYRKDGKLHVVDVKGYETKEWKLKWKMARARWPEYEWLVVR